MRLCRVVRFIAVLCVPVLLVSCGGGSNTLGGGGGRPNPELTKIEIAPANKSVAKGVTLQLSATGILSDGTQENLSSTAAWQANPSTVATISAQGDLTGLAVGVAQVSAVYKGVTGTTSITVGPPALIAIVVSPNQSSLHLGDSETMTATGDFSDGTTQNLNQSVSWDSSQPSVAGINAAGAVVSKGVGLTTISATEGSVTGSANLTVTTAVVVGLSIAPAQSSLVLGGNGQLQAVASFSDGTTQEVTGSATWSSSQPGIVAVNSAGVVTAERVGNATILADSGGFSASASLTVTPLMTVSYFDRANAVSSGYDGTLQLVNPGFTPADLCAMVYVFDSNQELNECCGCRISDSGLLTLSLLHDLTANPLTGKPPTAGTILMVPSDLGQGGQCNADSPAPDSVILGWETNVQGSTGTYQLTETPATTVSLSNTEAQVLAHQCAAVQQLGSGTGVCSCGTGD